MRLKQCIFALVAMLLCAFSANAQVTTEAALKEALTAGGDVTLGADINVATQIEIPAGVTVVLDLAGYDIIGGWNGSSTTNHIYVLSNSGTLTIKDSGTEGKIVSRGIYNYGVLTLESGIIDACDGNGGYAVNNESGSTFIMNGGVVSTSVEDDYQNEEGGFDATALDVPAGCEATLNGGKVTSVCDFTFAISAAGTLNIPSTSTVVVEGNHGAISVSGGVTTIDAGTFKVIKDNYTRTDNVTYVSGGKLIINGGTFEGDKDTAAGGCCVSDLTGGATINGGSFSNSSGGDVNGTTGTTINGGTFENLIETQHVAVGATITNGGKTYTKAENGDMVEATIVEVATYDELVAALANGGKIKLTADITVDTKITAIDGTELDLNEKTLYINVENSYYNNVTVKNGNIVLGKDDVTVCDGYFLINPGKTLVLDGVNMSSSAEGIKGYAVFHLKTGANLDLLNSTLNIADNEYSAGYIVYAGEATATVDIVKTTITGSKVNGIVHATTVIDESTVTLTNVIEHGINRSGVTIDDSNVAISGGTGRGITAQHGDLVVTGNSTVDIKDMGEATIELRNDKNLSVAETATVTLDVAVNNTTNGTISGTVNLPVVYVAKIGETEYSDFAAALTAASAMSGDVTVEVYDKVTLNTAFSGSYSSINFVGKDADAEIYLDVQGYITATGKKVSFTDLTLSKSAAGFIDNAGFMNVAFGIYDVAEVIYTDCVFANGAYAASGKVTYNGCTFYRSHDKYGLWAYGNVDATVEGCTFADYRGIKMYAEGAAKTVDLTVKNTDFSAVNDKPAIVLTYGESVALEGNTYSSTGTFELDLDGAPNGTAVTSDVAPTCKNDNGACGVLVDGKIYTTVAQAVEVATDGSNVTLLYSTTETAEFAEGVNLTLADGVTADNVTVATSGVAVAKIGDVEYTSLQAALDAAAAGTGNVTVTILADVDLTGIVWTPVTVSGTGYPLVTVEGNYKTITGLNDMLFDGTWAGKSGIIIKNLTIANSAIVNDKEDAAGTVGVGAFIGFPQASATITLENCHLKNSSVEGGHWTGGLIGYAAGYAGEDGPVFMNLTVKNCSVTGSTITGKGSVGGIIGHGSGNGWTNVVIEETTVKDNTITSTGSSTNKAGAIMGTIGAAGQPTTANGVTKTGGASVSATVAGNTVKSNNTVITTIYGRQGTETGMLYVAGGSYDKYPIEQGVAYAAPIEGYEIVQNTDGTYGLDEKVELPEVEITDIKGSLTDSDPDLTFALNFTIKDLENLDEEYLNKVMEQYGSWYTDYVLTISGLTDENVTFNANGDSDGYLAGQYDGFGPNWVSVPFENVTLANNESIYIMEYAAKLMGQSGLRYTLAEIVSIVMDFDCGVYFTPEFLTANPGLKVDLHLKVFTEDTEGNKVNDINVATNNFDVEDYVAIVHADGKQTTYCTTLAEAVEAAEADETITLIADVELTETLNIPAGKTIALDLNGKTISQTKEQTAGYQMILNDGNLTIDDSSEAKTGKISYTDSGNGGEYISDVIYNRAVLVINGGTIENLSSATVASNGYPHAVDTYSGIRDTYVEINGGTIYCAEYSAIRMFCVSATNKADLVINGGTIKGAIDMQNGTKNLALGTLTINDGTFETTKNANNIRFANWNGGATEYGISAEIKGGSFNGGITTAYVPAAANWDKGVITGGTFAKDMTEYCAEGFVCEANADGTYGVVADPNLIAELTIDDANPEDYTSDLAGMKVGKLTYKRTFIAGIWNPMFVPFEIDVERLVNEFGLEVASYNQMISSEQADGSFEYTMEVKHRTSGKVSHYPLFVRTEDSYELEYVAENVVLSSADEFVITTNSVANTFKLHGTHQAKTKEDLAGMYAIGATTGLWAPSSSGIKPHRLYFEILDNSNDPFASSVPAKSIRIVVEGEDGTTGVDEIAGENAEEMIFDLQGRRVLEPQKGGLYIVNGKKVIF